MPLIAYMKNSDPGRISTITGAEGDRTKRKKIYPIDKDRPDVYVTMYVMDCLSHEAGGVAVPVVLKRFLPGGTWEELGVAKCCPLCWKVLKPPVGIELPVVADPNVAANKYGKVKVKTAGKHHKTTGKKDGSIAAGRIQQVTRLLDRLGVVTVADVMQELGLQRSNSYKYLEMMVKVRRAIKEPGGRGKGDQNSYRKAP
jgi:hypothetical protein